MGAALLLGSCAGREANPEPVDWAYDHYYTCKDIRAEKARIQVAQQNRGIEQAAIKQSNDEMMTRSVPLFPGFFAIDESRVSSKTPSPQQAEIDALKARNAHLDSMAADRGC